MRQGEEKKRKETGQKGEGSYQIGAHVGLTVPTVSRAAVLGEFLASLPHSYFPRLLRKEGDTRIFVSFLKIRNGWGLGSQWLWTRY